MKGNGLAMPSQLEEEIKSQPEVIAHLLESETEHITNIVAQLPEFHYALIAARGSSDHAATYAKYAWAALAGYPVALATPSLQTLYHTSPRMSGALVVGISQSGQSPDIVAVLEEGKRQGRPTLAITNDASSPLAAAADHVVELHTGPERSIAATKTYTAQLVVMVLFAAAWRHSQQHMNELQGLPEALAKIHPRFHTPVFAIVLYAAVTWLLAVTGTFLWVAAVSAASSLVLYSAVCASLIRLREVRPDPNALRISFGPALAVASIAISLALISALNLRQAGLMGFTALMATANWWWAKRQESKTASKIAVASLP